VAVSGSLGGGLMAFCFMMLPAMPMSIAAAMRWASAACHDDGGCCQGSTDGCWSSRPPRKCPHRQQWSSTCGHRQMCLPQTMPPTRCQRAATHAAAARAACAHSQKIARLMPGAWKA
jgi:hypothetical protein